MATLNTLRTKGGVVLVGVIGVSLLAFLLGDLATSGSTLFQSSKMNVGEINGENISYQDYLTRIEKLTLAQQIASNSETLSEQQTLVVRNSAWEQMAREASFDYSLQKLGLTVNDNEMSDMATGDFLSPVIEAVFVNRETGSFDPLMLAEYVTSLNEDPSGRARFFWNYIESEMSSERVMSKYMALVKNGMYVTNSEVASRVAANNDFYNIRFVTKSINAVPDSAVTVSNADLRAYYDTHLRLFKQSEMREIEYVTFDAVPTSADYADAQKTATELATEFAVAEDVLSFVKLNSQQSVNPTFQKREEMLDTLRQFAFSATKADMFGPVFVNNGYVISRIVDVKEFPDTVGVRQILVAPTDRPLADSLLKVIKAGGASFADLANQYSLDKSVPGGDMGRIAPASITVPEFAGFVSDLLSSNKGDVFISATPYGLHIVENTYRGPLFKKAKLATINFVVEPSTATQQDVYAKASVFATSVSASGADFEKAVADSALLKRVARLKAGDNTVSDIDQSQEIVRWAFGATQGAVSDVISIGESNIIVRLATVREHGVVPFDQISAELKPAVLNQKKVEYVAKQMEGATSLDELSSKLGTSVKEATDVNFNSYYIPDLGIAPRAIGAISATKSGKLTKPVEAGIDVAVIEVSSKDVRSESDAATEKIVLQSNVVTQIGERAYEAVFDLADIRDTRIKFF